MILPPFLAAADEAVDRNVGKISNIFDSSCSDAKSKSTSKAWTGGQLVSRLLNGWFSSCTPTV